MGTLRRRLKWGAAGTLGALGLAVALTFTPGCHHYRVTAFDEDDAVISYSETKHSFFWGIKESPIHLSPTSEDPRYRCESNSLYEVEVTRNFGHALATVLTLGIWAPARVEWTCATVPDEVVEEDDIGDLPEDEEETEEVEPEDDDGR